MDYSTKSSTDSAKGVCEPLAGTLVQDIAQAGEGRPVGWVELMEAVEALCPLWLRATDESVENYRL